MIFLRPSASSSSCCCCSLFVFPTLVFFAISKMHAEVVGAWACLVCKPVVKRNATLGLAEIRASLDTGLRLRSISYATDSFPFLRQYSPMTQNLHDVLGSPQAAVPEALPCFTNRMHHLLQASGICLSGIWLRSGPPQGHSDIFNIFQVHACIFHIWPS